ncbi:MAG TPA: hypothetical protein VL361_11670 [Candidatus Limnocylindrales bacterium]|nr:hypothetical protein [Candidatus Limnocylindrales bacterium]
MTSPQRSGSRQFRLAAKEGVRRDLLRMLGAIGRRYFISTLVATMEQEQLSSETARRRRGLSRLRFVWIPLVALAVVLFILWHALLPSRSNSLPGSITERDRKEIAALCRQHTMRFAAGKLRSGEFGWFARSVRVLFEQKIDRLIDDHDGTYRAYVVVCDPRDPDGFVPWYRHQLTRTNGHWTILRSY